MGKSESKVCQATRLSARNELIRMSRDVTDADGTTWTCIQAFAGLRADADKAEAARVDGAPDHVHVVCTPSGGAKSVRVQLPEAWEQQLSDEKLLQLIRANLKQDR